MAKIKSTTRAKNRRQEKSFLELTDSERQEYMRMVEESDADAWEQGAFMETSFGKLVTNVIWGLGGLLILWEFYLQIFYQPSNQDFTVPFPEDSPELEIRRDGKPKYLGDKFIRSAPFGLKFPSLQGTMGE